METGRCLAFLMLFVCESVHADIIIRVPGSSRPHKPNTVARACELLQELAGEPAERFLTRLTGVRKPHLRPREFDLLSTPELDAHFSNGDLFLLASVEDGEVSAVTLVLRKELPRDVFLRAAGIEQTGVWSFKLMGRSEGCTIDPYQGPQGEIRGVTVSVP